MRRRKNRVVAPVIATLLMVAIAVTGGTVIFVFSQEFFNIAQMSSGAPSFESVKVLGYDARDVSQLTTHDGLQTFKPYSGGDGDGLFEKNERIAIYVKNDSQQPITISEISFGGTVYEYANAEGLQSVGDESSIPGGTYDFWLGKGDENHDVLLQEYLVNHDTALQEYLVNHDISLQQYLEINDISLQGGIQVIEPGDSVTTILALDSNFKVGRDVSFRITTTNGGIFMGTIIMGQNMS